MQPLSPGGAAPAPPPPNATEPLAARRSARPRREQQAAVNQRAGHCPPDFPSSSATHSVGTSAPGYPQRGCIYWSRARRAVHTREAPRLGVDGLAKRPRTFRSRGRDVAARETHPIGRPRIVRANFRSGKRPTNSAPRGMARPLFCAQRSDAHTSASAIAHSSAPGLPCAVHGVEGPEAGMSSPSLCPSA